MNCSKHNCKMIQLFSSWACDECDGLIGKVNNKSINVVGGIIEIMFNGKKIDKNTFEIFNGIDPAGIIEHKPIKFEAIITNDPNFDWIGEFSNFDDGSDDED